jgi:nucleoside-diphosphate-sugar epimerase
VSPSSGVTASQPAITWSAPYAGRTVVVTGASGYIGSRLAEVLSAVRCRLVLLTREPRPLKLAGTAACRTVHGDVADAETWHDVLSEANVVFHLAAHEHRHGSRVAPLPDLDVNGRAVLQLLETCRLTGARPRIVLASSTNLYGQTEALPVDETAPDDPLHFYALHKRLAEQYLDHYARNYALESVALRLSNIYGPSATAAATLRSALNRMIAMAIEKQALVLFKNGDSLRDYLFIDDVITAFLAAGTAPRPWNGTRAIVGSGTGTSFRAAAELIADRLAARLGQRPRIDVNEDVAIDAAGWRSFVADTTRFREATGWAPTVDLTTGIASTVDSLVTARGGSG